MNTIRLSLVLLIALLAMRDGNAQQPSNVQKAPTGALTAGFNSARTHVFLSGADVTFSAGTTLTVNGTFGGTPTGGTLNLTNVTVSGLAGDITAATVNGVALSGTSTPTLAVTGTSSISGAHTGTSSGTNTGDQTSVSGNAGTATALQTARNINGEAFDGTANITVPAAAGTLTGATLASGVTASSLTSAAGGAFGTAAFTAATAHQPVDADLTSIAALATTSFGRGLLAETSASTTRSTLGLVIGTNVQAFDADLTTYAGITPSANIQSLLGAANYAAARALLDLEAGTDFLAYPTGTPNGSKFLRDDNSWQTITGGGDALVANPLSQFASTTSAQLAGVVSNETGSGLLVFGTSPTLETPALGTPTALVLTNATGLPIATGVSGLGTGIATALATPTSANLAAALTNETGTSLAVFSEAPTINAANLTGTTTATTVAVTMLVPSAVTWGSTVMPSANGGAGTINGILMANGSGTTSLAVSGTNYEPARTAISQADAEAGVATTVQGFTAQRVAQAIAALGAGGDSIPAGAAISWPTTGIGSPPTGYFAAGEYGTPAQVETGLWSKVVRSAGTIGAFTFSPAAGEVADGATISFVTGGGVAGTTFRHTFGDGTQAAPTFTTGTAGASAVISGAGTYKVTEIKAGYISATGSAAYTMVAAPTVSTRTIPALGTTLVVVHNETVTHGAGGSGGHTLSASGGATTPTYSSGAGTATLTYTLSRTVLVGETVTHSYTQPGNGVEDAAGNDLATFATQSVTNSSTADGITYIIKESFEGANASSNQPAVVGLDMTGWTATSANVLSQSTPATAGNYSLRLNNASMYRDSVAMTGATLYTYFKLTRLGNFATSSVGVVNSGKDGNILAVSATTMAARNGVTNGAAGAVLTLDQVYHVWIDYTPGSGNNGITRVYMSTDGIKPGVVYSEVTDGNATATTSLRFNIQNSNNTVRLDDFRVAHVVLGSSSTP